MKHLELIDEGKDKIDELEGGLSLRFNLTTFFNFLFGTFGFFFAIKEFGDPEFSDWARPGPGHPLLGDAGRMLIFEAGSDGI